MGTKSPFFRAWFGDWRAKDTTPVKIATEKGNARGVTKNNDTGWDINISGKVFNETKSHNSSNTKNAVSYLDYINSIVENAVLLDSYTIPSGNTKSENSAMMHSMYAIANIGNGNELIKLYVEEINDVNSDGTINRAYQLQNIAKAPMASVRVQNNIPSSLTSTTGADTYTVSQLFNLVKTFDKNFHPKETSAVVNEDGTPKVVYHGTADDFTVFDRTQIGKYDNGTSKTKDIGFFFTDNRELAAEHAEGASSTNGRNNNGNIVAAYLNIEKPLVIMVDEWYARRKYYDSQLWYDKNRTEILNKFQSGDYDGIIIKNPVRDDNMYMVMDSNQIKSATDNIGTYDKGNNDIRFSLKKSVEETKDLIAVHNLDADKLLLSAELGGFAMPSIAITKAKQGHSGFGDISLLFDKSTIDPQANEDNKVYAGDAYTPMFPKNVNKPNEKAIAVLAEKIGESKASLKVNYFDDKTTADAASALESNEKIRKAFVDDKGYKVVPVTRDPEFKFSGHRTTMARDFIRKHSFDEIINNSDIEKEYLEAIRGYYSGDKPFVKKMKEKYVEVAREIIEKYVEVAREIIEKSRSDAFFRATAEAHYNSDVDVANGNGERVTDAYSYRDGLDNIINEHKAEFEEYTKAIAQKVMGGKYIRNNKDIFDRNGNRRDFDELYDKYTLDNIVANMKAQISKGQSSIFTGASNVRGAVTKELYSIKDIKAEEGKIKSMSEEETEAVKEKFSDRLSGIIQDAVYGTRFNYTNALNDFSELLIETANKSSDIDNFIRNLKKDGAGYNLTSNVIKDIISLLGTSKN